MKYILIAAAGAVFFLTLATIGEHNNLHILFIIPFALAYVALLKFKQLKILLLVLVVAELTLASHVGLVQGGATTDRVNFPWVYEDVQQVLAERTPPDANFYRTDFTARWSSNDPSLYHLQGISIFSSLVNQDTLRFMRGLGLIAWPAGNSHAFAETSPLTPAVLNVRYLVDRLGNPADNGIFWQRIAQSNNVLLMQNKHPLALGFMTNPEIIDYIGDVSNPFNSQNDFFRRATGLDGDLFTLLPLGRSEGDVEFIMPFAGEIYAYVSMTNVNNIGVILGEEQALRRNIAISHRAPHLFRVGSFEAFEPLSLRDDAITSGGTAFVGILNRELFEQGHARLAAEMWDLSHFSATRISGSINAANAGILFTSIPYTGNWRATINGEKTDILAIDGAMSALHLPAGEFTVEFSYHNRAFTIGAIISLISLLIFVGFQLLRKFKI